MESKKNLTPSAFWGHMMCENCVKIIKTYKGINRVGLFQWDAAKPMANPTYLETRNLPTDVTPKLAVVGSFHM